VGVLSAWQGRIPRPVFAGTDTSKHETARCPEAWVEAYRHAEERIASVIGAARAAAEVQQRRLPVLLAERMQVGDLIADGVNMAAGPYTRATVIQPQLWA
jgi:hypothetical protein